jgi:hypothetical protein
MTQRQSGAIVPFFASSSRRPRSASLAVALIVAATALASCREQAPFSRETNAAMTRMMDGMDIKSSGDVDRDFVAMMVPHHQGAIEMAQAELRHGHNELLRRIAQEIIVTQQQEIAAMRLAAGKPLSASVSPLARKSSIVPVPAELPPSSRAASARQE